ncbi:unnamed protein product [Danaus chrysippus]|uniref:(African queen) hypothetical protein n=1 Tax=Danaus chrysippus TaxID=151541 RepID=A0A8J2QC84_9NEOP|nr:unnamed protein product [Danaus chrysippus]
MKFLSILLVGIFVMLQMGNIAAEDGIFCDELSCQSTCTQICLSATCTGTCINDVCYCSCIPRAGSSAKKPQQRDAKKQG